MLCGSGVVFKFVQAFLKKYGDEFGVVKEYEKWWLDMAGLATLADMVPLRKENRAIAHFGLSVLKKTRRPGLLQLFRKVGVDLRHLQEDDITFSIVPKLNAASRMDTPRRAYELLSSSDEGIAGAHVEHLSNINNERKLLVAQIMKSVKKTFSHEERKERSVIVVGDPSWRIGVLGLVAGKIVDEYRKPAFVWGMEGGTIIKGSCRSDGSANLVELMQTLPEKALLDFGGHEGAGGFSVSHEEIFFLEERLVDSYEKVKRMNIISDEKIKPDAHLMLSEVNEKTFEEIALFAPFGVENPKPVFAFDNVVVSEIKMFGKTKEHLELRLSDSSKPLVKAIAFFKTANDFSKKFREGDTVTLFAHIEKSVFGYKKEIRLRIIEIK
jgi:single-stranded-DNA-specific exonuclease